MESDHYNKEYSSNYNRLEKEGPKNEEPKETGTSGETNQWVKYIIIGFIVLILAIVVNHIIESI